MGLDPGGREVGVALQEPMSPFNTTNETMTMLNRALLDAGLSTVVRWHTVMTSPPLCITAEQLAEGFEILDSALGIADREVGD